MNKLTKLPDAELEVMRAVWSAEDAISTTDIRKILEKEKPYSVGALQTLLARLEKREFLESFMQGKSKFFKSKVLEDEYLAFISKSFLSKLSRNSITRLVAALYDSNAITEADLAELDEFIESKRKNGE